MKLFTHKKNSFYITTPIYYVNDLPHIGHAYTTIAADVVARFCRTHGKQVFFLTGTDEHGQKIEKSAESRGITPQKLVDEVVASYKVLWKNLDISYDKFIRTTDKEHIKTVQQVFQVLYDKGDIYLGKYEGLYCTPCETYYSETQAGEAKVCPECNKELAKVSEHAYFFKLSAYQNKLLDYYKLNPDFLSPPFRSKEMINFVKQGLHDLCVTRTTVKWGVPVPFDNKHYVYVWFDALINYISAIGFIDYFKNGCVENGHENKRSVWPVDVHFVGKEIFKFHTIIWPAMLMALGLELPKKVFAHGWWTVEGKKMSKSQGNVVNPNNIIKEFNSDVLRYFLLREVPFGSDGDFSHTSLVTRYNTELANDLGNLVSRVLKMIDKYFKGAINKVNIDNTLVNKKINEVIEKYNESFEKIALTESLLCIFDLISFANKYIDEKAPWKIAKDEANKDVLEKILFELWFTIQNIAVLLDPFMPQTSESIYKQLGLKSVMSCDIPKKITIGEVRILFPRKE